MATFDFRILLETVEGVKTSYYSSSFIDTSQDLVLSASQVYHRITGSVSASYQNNSIFSGSNVNTNFTFKDNTLLSASLSGSLDTGSINFTALDTEYDRLLRYKFIGDKVCNVLGLPSSQWVYVDQFRLPADDEANFIEGNIRGKNAFFNDTITFANTSNVNSDIPFLIDTGSDRYVKFVDERGIPEAALRMGYDVDADVYEISGSQNFTTKIGGFDLISGSVFTAGGIINIRDEVQIFSMIGDNVLTFAGGSDVKKITYGRSGGTSGTNGSGHLFIGNITASGNISASGDVIARTGSFQRLETTVVSSSIIFSSGSNIFGDAIGDTHLFNGHITGSGNISASGIITGEGLVISDDAEIADDLTVKGTLHVTSSTDPNLILEDPNGSSVLRFRRTDQNKNIDLSMEGNDLRIISTDNDGSQNVLIGVNAGSVKRDNRLGIGQPSPSEALDVSGSINVSGPGYITASGNISSSGTTTTKFLQIRQDTGGSGEGGALFFGSAQNGNNGKIYDDGTNLILSHNDADIIKIHDTGTKLEVFGNTVLRDDVNLGNALTDKITIAGHITASGNISGSSTSTINVGGAINTLSHITASGNISSSGNLSVTGDLDLDGKSHFQGNITASGNISASGTIIASKFTSAGGSGELISFNDNLTVVGHITASGNISGSSTSTINVGGDITTLGTINADEIHSVTQTTNKLILEDDQSLATNMVSLMSVNFVNIISDGNNNGTGKVRILDGNYDADSATEVAEFSPEGIDFHAPLHISGTAANQKLLFIEDEIGNDILVVSSSNTLGKVGIGTSTPQNNLSVSGSLTVFAPDATSRITVGEQDTADEATGNVVIIEGTGASNKSRIFTKNTSNDMHIESLGNNSDIDLSAKRDIRFGINNGSAFNFTEKMIMKADGMLGIGTSAPTVLLQVTGIISSSGDLHTQGNITASAANFSSHITASGNISQSEAGNILSNGTVSSIGPLYQAQVNNGTSAGPRFTLGGLADADSFMSIEASGGINKIDTKARDFHIFSTAATTGFYFDEDNANIGIQTTSPVHPLQVEGNITASGVIKGDGGISGSNGTFTGDVTFTSTGSAGYLTATEISSSGKIIAKELLVQAVANNVTPFVIRNVEGDKQLDLSIDTNKHSELGIFKDGTEKIKFNSYWPGVYDNDFYETGGALILGTDTTQAANRYGIFVSAGPDSGSAFFAENVKIGGGQETAPTERLEINAGGRIKVTPGSDATGSILSLANDHDVLFSSQNDSAGGDPQQFVLQHNDGHTELVNRRGNLILSSSGDITIGAPGKDVTLTDNDGTAEFIFNLEDAPELDVDGDFTIDGSGLIKLDSATTNIDLVGNVTASGNFLGGGFVSGSEIISQTHITASGNISSSATGSFGKMTIGTSAMSHANTQLTIVGGLGGNDIARFTRDTAHGASAEPFVSINANSADPQIRFFEGTDQAAIGQDATNSNLVFATGSRISEKEAMVIDTDGKVGINTTAPTKALQVKGSISSSGDIHTLSHITASGNISASGNVILNSGASITFGGADNAVITSDASNLDISHIQGSFEGGMRVSTFGDIEFAAVQDGDLDFDADRTMTISASGEVGIGTSSPEQTLEVSGSGITIHNGNQDGVLKIKRFSGDIGQLSAANTRFTVRALNNKDLSLEDDAGNVGVFVKDGGKVGIGADTTPTVPLQVTGDISASGILKADTGISSSADIQIEGAYSGSATSTFVIGGKLSAGSKSFLINNPDGGKLEYGVLEGQQNDVFYRGELKGDNVIYLPKEWKWLVDENTITIQLTSIGKHQDLFVKEIKDNKIFIDINGIFKTKENIHCYHTVYGTRKDIELIRNYQ